MIMTHEQIKSSVPGGGYTLLAEIRDEHGRDVAHVEYADARRGYVREELDGAIRFYRSTEFLDA